jgi:hypothetical protein
LTALAWDFIILIVERQWELYRRSVIERMPDSDYKTAVLAAIEHRLMMLDRREAASIEYRHRWADPGREPSGW